MLTKIKKYASPLAISSLMLFSVFNFSSCKGKKGDMVEKDGLKATINSISRIDTSKIEMEYKLEWSDSPGAWIINPSEPANFYFWNSSGQRVDDNKYFETILIQDGFRNRSMKSYSILVTSAIPTDAVEVSVVFGSSGLETKRKDIPSL
jgi:hypothetical protein